MEIPKKLFMMSKIQNLNGTHNNMLNRNDIVVLFMMSKIQNLNGTHNALHPMLNPRYVVYDVKDTKFEWNSQLTQVSQQFLNCCL